MISLKKELRTHITTEEAAYHLNRKPQTLRVWACYQNGLILPIKINGRLAWPVDQIRSILKINID